MAVTVNKNIHHWKIHTSISGKKWFQSQIRRETGRMGERETEIKREERNREQSRKKERNTRYCDSQAAFQMNFQTNPSTAFYKIGGKYLSFVRRIALMHCSIYCMLCHSKYREENGARQIKKWWQKNWRRKEKELEAKIFAYANLSPFVLHAHPHITNMPCVSCEYGCWVFLVAVILFHIDISTNRYDVTIGLHAAISTNCRSTRSDWM